MYGPFLYIFNANGWWLTNHFILASVSRRRALFFFLAKRSQPELFCELMNTYKNIYNWRINPRLGFDVGLARRNLMSGSTRARFLLNKRFVLRAVRATLFCGDI